MWAFHQTRFGLPDSDSLRFGWVFTRQGGPGEAAAGLWFFQLGLSKVPEPQFSGESQIAAVILFAVPKCGVEVDESRMEPETLIHHMVSPICILCSTQRLWKHRWQVFPLVFAFFLLSQRWLINLGMFSCGLFVYQTFSGVFTTDVTKDGRGFQGPLPAEHLYWSFWSPPWNEQIPTAFFTPLRLQDLPAAWRFQGMKIVVWPQLYGCLKFTTQKLEMKSVFYVEPGYPGMHPLSSLRGCQGHLEVRNFCTALW